MKIKTADLIGPALDWAVAVVEGLTEENAWTTVEIFKAIRAGGGYWYSTDWSKGGPLIEREWLDLTSWPNESNEDLRWECTQYDSINCHAFGPTPLIAAMRCVVAATLGDEVEVPDELV